MKKAIVTLKDIRTNKLYEIEAEGYSKGDIVTTAQDILLNRHNVNIIKFVSIKRA